MLCDSHGPGLPTQGTTCVLGRKITSITSGKELAELSKLFLENESDQLDYSGIFLAYLNNLQTDPVAMDILLSTFYVKNEE